MPEKEREEMALIARLRSGEELAFRELIRTHQEKVYQHCLNMTGNRSAAEDITQEVFLEIFRAIRKFRGDSTLTTWIYRIATNKTLESIRKERRQKRGGTDKQIIPIQHFTEPMATNFDHPGIALEKQEEARWLYHCLDLINERQRTALLMHQMDGLKQEEIAEIMGTTPSAVESLIHRAKQQLRKLLVRPQPGPFHKNQQDYEKA